MSHLPLGPGREFDRIRAIERALGAHAAQLGDDCAIVGPFPHRVVLSTDVSVEDTHFRRAWLTPEEIGWRAASAALSDLAAEGAEAIGLLMALTLPAGTPEEDVTAIMRGVGEAATAAGGRVLGGDLSRGPSMALAVTVVGRAVRPVTRRGAQPGDSIWLTGVLGGPRAALQAWEAGREPLPECRRLFAHPTPRLPAGRLFAHVGATALIDVSDGLAGDARHLAAASGVRLEIDLARVPLADGVRQAAAAAGQEPEAFAAEGGEDYELLAAVPPDAEPMLRELAARAEVPLTRIGRVVAGEGVLLSVGGRALPLGSFDHFA
ncbi:MAG TPA: thiamine-phosphate kinase [Gemmatimonadales bacterium]|nr:thiamine-phosphate kinase [Gemmatimonadales bacterium]